MTMRYESLLFMRYEQQDYSALVHPSGMSDDDITTLSAIFNRAPYPAGLSGDFPSLYYFPLGQYALLVRHYDSKHEGKAGAVVEGAAVKLGSEEISPAIVAKFVLQQADLLNVSAGISDIAVGNLRVSDEREVDAVFESAGFAPFVEEFLERHAQERLFLPFTEEGRATLAAILADSRFDAPPYFAFGTNSDVLAQLEQLATIDVVSFFKTERSSFRDRKTNQVSKYLDGDSDEPDYQTRRVQLPERYAKPPTDEDDADRYEDTRVGTQAMPTQRLRQNDGEAETTNGNGEYDPDDTVLTMQQIPAGAQNNEVQESNPLRRVTKKLSSLLSPRKTE